jgi:rod shape-determining protein MreD
MKTASLKWFGLFILCFVLQTTIVPFIGIAGIHPDFPLIALFFLGFRTGPMPSLWAGFFIGLSGDLYSTSILGQNTLSKTIAGFFAGIFNERVMRIDTVIQMVLLVLTFMVNDFVYVAVQMIKSGGGGGDIARHCIIATLPRALYSMLFALIPYLKNHLFGSSTPRL